MPTDCPLEAAKQSRHSPSKVSNTETLLFVLVEPHNFGENELSARAFSRKELTKGHVSVSRKEHTTRSTLEENVISVLLKNDVRREFKGVLKAKCQKVRDIKTDNPLKKRVFCVVDDGVPDNPGHAHIGFSEITKTDNGNEKTAYRENLILAFGENPFGLNDIYK